MCQTTGQKTKKQILIIDDEESVTRYLFRALRGIDYDVDTANSALDGLKIIESKNIDLIITDMRMPAMNGYELLAYVKQNYPGIIRIILSGDSDRNIMVKAIADGTARSYLTKPIRNDNLKQHISRLFVSYDLLHQCQLLHIVKKINGLPALPSIYNKLCSMIEQNMSINEIAEFISTDPTYSAKILHIVNSTFFAAKIGSIHQALVYLGLETLKHLVLGTEFFRTFIQLSTDKSEIRMLWEHSRITNLIFHAIYRAIHKSSVPDEYSCCGLLHDTGVLLIAEYFPEQYKSIKKMINDENCPLEQAEDKILGVQHSSLGAFLLDWWNLPQSIVETTLYHHNPHHIGILNIEMCAILHISDYYSWKFLKCDYRQISETVFDLIKLDKKTVEKIIQSLPNTGQES